MMIMTRARCVRFQRTSQRFYPTRLAINLATGVSDSSAQSVGHEGYIVVETNYRICAYTGT